MWNLSSNRLSFEDYVRLRCAGYKYREIIDHAVRIGKQCNTNLCSIYESAKIINKDTIIYKGISITKNTVDQCLIHRAYIPYFREHFGLPTRRNTVITSDFAITEKQKQILLGTILGDGHIPKNCNYLNMTHGILQKSYLQWKTNNLGKLIQSDIKECSYKDNRINKTLTNVYINSIPHFFIRSMRDAFYIPSKQPALSFLKNINALGLAVWYCDDGSIIRDKARLCTNSFDHEHLESTINVLKHLFGFDNIWINNQNILVFSRKSSLRMKSIIREFVPDCMKYKLGE